MNVTITPFDPVRASDQEMAEHHAIALATQPAPGPRTPAYTLEFHTAFMRTGMTLWGPRRFWVARDEGRIVGSAIVDFPEHEAEETAITQIRVLPEARRRGIGNALLLETLPDCRAGGRKTVVAVNVPADGEGEAWTRSLGFTRVARWVRQGLDLTDDGPGLWEVPLPDGYRTVSWSGSAPQELVAGFARARSAIEDAPTGESSLAWPDWTAERVRQYEADAVRRGCELHTVVVVHEATGTVVALTEIELQDGQPDTALQQETVVVPAYRGRGLGRAVKAAMIRRLRAERPDVVRTITNTSADNEHMIRVNLQLGYVTERSLVELEAPLEPLLERLTAAAPAV